MLMNSRILFAVGLSTSRTNTSRIDRMTRVTMAQQRVSFMRIACVQKRITGSRIWGDERMKWRIESAGVGWLAAPFCLLGSVVFSGSVFPVKG